MAPQMGSGVGAGDLLLGALPEPARHLIRAAINSHQKARTEAAG